MNKSLERIKEVASDLLYLPAICQVLHRVIEPDAATCNSFRRFIGKRNYITSFGHKGV